MAWLGVITNNGNDLLTRWVEGKNLHITRAAAGQGRVEQTAMLAQSALVNEKQTVRIVSNTPATIVALPLYWGMQRWRAGHSRPLFP